MSKTGPQQTRAKRRRRKRQAVWKNRPLCVVRWVSYHSEHPDPEDPYSDEREKAVYEGIRRDNIHHCGNCHQRKDYKGAPLFSDGTVFRESMKNWAVTMAHVWLRAGEVSGILDHLGVGWTVCGVGDVYPYSCGHCREDWPKGDYKPLIGPIHAYRTVDTGNPRVRFSWDNLYGGNVVLQKGFKI